MLSGLTLDEWRRGILLEAMLGVKALIRSLSGRILNGGRNNVVDIDLGGLLDLWHEWMEFKVKRFSKIPKYKVKDSLFAKNHI